MTPHPTSLLRPQRAIGAMFLVNGMVFSSWLPRLPELQERFDVSDGVIGLTLLGAGLGGVLVSAASGRFVQRFGSRAVTVATSLALSAGLPLVGFAPTAAVLFAVLIGLGALDGLTDVAMNTQGIELERRKRRSIISRLHALWSLGAVLGGAAASRAAAAGLSLRLHLTVVTVVLIATTLWATGSLLVDDRGAPADQQTRPGRRSSARLLVGLFLVGLTTALAEMPPNEWAALLLSQRFEVSSGAAALGFVATAGGMLVGRIIGDHVADALGSETTRRGGAAVAAVGVAVATLAPWPVLAGAGLFLTGLGLSSLFPLAFRAASEIAPNPHTGLAAFSTGARAGILLSPPLVGQLADRTSLRVSLLVVAGTAAAIVAIAGLPRPAVTPPS